MHLGVVSVILFWAMMQMGIAVTVACLPTLRPLFHGFSPESIIHSIRSRISLRLYVAKALTTRITRTATISPELQEATLLLRWRTMQYTLEGRRIFEHS